MRRKVFGIGLPQTHEYEVSHAMWLVGWRAHNVSATVNERIEQAHADGLPLLTPIGGYDAWFGAPALTERFDVLDEQYPGSLFLLTTRELERWLDVRGAVAVQRGEPVDRLRWEAEWNRHHGRVIDYFAGRDDLLVMNASDGWRVLCPFLGVKRPRKRWPHWYQSVPV